MVPVVREIDHDGLAELFFLNDGTQHMDSFCLQQLYTAKTPAAQVFFQGGEQKKVTRGEVRTIGRVISVSIILVTVA